MSGQLTTCIDVEVSTVPGSRPTAVHRRILATAAALGSQFLAFVAAAGNGETTNPILDPALSHAIALGVGIIVGAVVVKVASK